MKTLRFIAILTLFLIFAGCAEEPSAVDVFKKQSAAQILAGGEQALIKGNYRDAMKHFEALDILYPFSSETEQGQLDVIYAYFQDQEYEAAATAAERYIHLYPRGARVDYAYYMQGLSNFERDESWWQRLYKDNPAEHDLSTLREAFNNFSELVRNFPDSKYSKDARTHMIYIRNVMASHELDVAKFYFERKAYVAASNRATNVVQHYQGSPQVKEALQVLIKSYEKLNANKQVEEAKRVYRLNYGK